MAGYNYTPRINPYQPRLNAVNAASARIPVARPYLEVRFGSLDRIGMPVLRNLQGTTFVIVLPESKTTFSGINSSAIAQVDSRIADFSLAMNERVRQGKMPAARFSELEATLSGLREQAQGRLTRGDFAGFSETSGAIEGLIRKSEFLSEMYADRLKLGVMRQTIGDAYAHGIISADEKAFLGKELAEKVRENANALIAGDENRFMTSLMDLLRMAEVTDAMRQGLDVFRLRTATGDLSGMNKAAEEKILPRMRVANNINRELLYGNRLTIEFASRFLTDLRAAQSAVLKNTREQLDRLSRSPEISQKDAKDIMIAAQVVAQTSEQIAITDLNETTIPADLWMQIWDKASGPDLESYAVLKKGIVEEQKLISELFEALAPRISVSDTKSGACLVMPSSEAYVPSEIFGSAATAQQSSKLTPADFFAEHMFRYLIDIMQKQSEARRKAAEKKAEEESDERRAEEKRTEARLLEKKLALKDIEEKRLQRKVLTEAAANMNAILEMIKAQQQLCISSGAEEGASEESLQAGRNIVYLSRLAEQQAERAAAAAKAA